MIFDEIEPAWQVFYGLLHKPAMPRKRPPLGLLVIAKLTLRIDFFVTYFGQKLF